MKLRSSCGEGTFGQGSIGYGSDVVIGSPHPIESGASRARLPGVPGSVSEARRFAHQALAPRVEDEDALHDAQLVTCELVSNAVKHAIYDREHWIEVVAAVDEEQVISISVSDPGPGFEPAERYDPPVGVSGWGLVIVSRVSSRWGAWPGQRFTVWAEIDPTSG
jgi:anti-sigma regulatory factor (Ser/Thr protein kinase)